MKLNDSIGHCIHVLMKEVELNSIISSKYILDYSLSELEGIISKEEALSALKIIKNHKSPGNDGFTTEF